MKKIAYWVVVVAMVATAVVVWAVGRPSDPAPRVTPSTTVTVGPDRPGGVLRPAPTVTPSVDSPDRVLADLGTLFVEAMQYGIQGGGDQWVEKLRPVASDDLVAAVTAMAPDDIEPGIITAVVVESRRADGSGVVSVSFLNGHQLRLVAERVGGHARVVKVENPAVS